MMTAAKIEAHAESLKQAAIGVVPMIRSVLTGGSDRARTQRNAAIAFLVR